MSDELNRDFNEPQGDIIELNSDIKMWAMICHLAALVGYIIPFGNIVGPLIVWQMKKQESPFIDEHGREAVNFQITYTIYVIVALFSMLLLVGFLLLPVVVVAQIIFVVIAAIKANSGESYRIPFILRLV